MVEAAVFKIYISQKCALTSLYNYFYAACKNGLQYVEV
jgi:hypothetical protein